MKRATKLTPWAISSINSAIMSPTERKSLGISKSGLWRQKKKFTEGKAVKVYAKMLKK